MTDSIQVAVGVVDGNVVAKWHQPTDQIVFDPKNAYTVGMALAQAAMDAHRGFAQPETEFLCGELKVRVSDEKRMYLVNVVATQLKSLIEKGATPGKLALHAVDAVLQETAR